MYNKVILILILAVSMVSADVNTAAFLKTSYDATGSALAGAMVSYRNVFSATSYNPAAASWSARKTMAGGYSQIFEDSQFNYASLIVPGRNYAWGLNLIYFIVKDIDKYSNTGSMLGSDMNNYNASYEMLYSYLYRNKLSLGVKVKSVNEKLDDYTTSAWAVDTGLQYQLFQKTMLGVSVSNLGQDMGYVEKYSLPKIFRAGITQYLIYDTIALSVQSNKIVNEDVYNSFALELFPVDYLTVRMGYKSGDMVDNISFGIGITANNISLNYSFTPSDVLGVSHKIDISWEFGQSPKGIEAAIQKKRREKAQADQRLQVAQLMLDGDELFKRARLFEAMAKYAQILTIDKGNRIAINKIKNTNSILQGVGGE